MQELHYIESVPCQFERSLENQCKKPSKDGWCEEHRNLRCICCGNKAIKECRFTDEGHHIAGGYYRCLAYLCANCQHQPYVPGKIMFPDHHIHITKAEAAELLKDAFDLEDLWKSKDSPDEEWPRADS